MKFQSLENIIVLMNSSQFEFMVDTNWVFKQQPFKLKEGQEFIDNILNVIRKLWLKQV